MFYSFQHESAVILRVFIVKKLFREVASSTFIFTKNGVMNDL